MVNLAAQRDMMEEMLSTACTNAGGRTTRHRSAAAKITRLESPKWTLTVAY
jgi:hypothetical protein